MTAEDDWREISDEVKDLIKQMLAFFPKKRISASEALGHKWIRNNYTSQVLKKSVFENLSSFQVQAVNERVKLTSGTQ